MNATLSAATTVALVASLAIPALSALLAKAHWPDWLVGVLSLGLAAVNGFVTEWVKAGDGFAWKTALEVALGSYAIAVLSHYGLVKGDAYQTLKAVGSKQPDTAGDNFDGSDPLDGHVAEHAAG